MASFPSKSTTSHWPTMFALMMVILVALMSIFATVVQRYMFIVDPQIFLSPVEQSGKVLVPEITEIRVPGGLNWIIGNEERFHLLYIQIGMIGSILFGLLSLLVVHRVADVVAFHLVDTSKIAAIGRRLQLAYGITVFAFVLVAVSFLFDISLTMGVFLEEEALFTKSFLGWMEVYYPVVMLVGVGLSLALAVWWARTVEYPRGVKFQTEN
jgi:hypothetical protein